MDKYINAVKKVAQHIMNKDGFEETVKFARLLEAHNEAIVRRVSMKLRRIFTPEEIDMLALAVRSMTNRYIPPKIANYTPSKEDFESMGMPNIIPFPNSSRN